MSFDTDIIISVLDPNGDREIIEISDSNIDGLQEMAEESTANGQSSIQKTVDEWKSEVNKFSKPGEILYGIVVDGIIVAMGGLNQDPYINDANVGRVRHVYVLKKYRGFGLSRIILNLIINLARENFKTLRLSTMNPVAASLYESMGFEKIDEFKATHIIRDLQNY